MSHQKLYILLVNDYEVATYIPSTSSQQNVKQTEVIQEEVSPEVSKVNHSVMNKKRGNKIEFSQEKKTQKKKKERKKERKKIDSSFANRSRRLTNLVNYNFIASSIL